MIDNIYPAGPRSAPAELTRPTSIYKRRAWMAVSSLALFVLIYVALAGWFIWTAYRLIGEGMAGGPGAFVHFIVGSCAAFLAIFMVKAMFFLKRGGAPDAVQVTAAEQPRLFAFLHRLADEAGAPRPKKVYLSGRVNAAVFYDLSVLNLLFPSKKNLEIGLALVNVLTLSEIKAVLAHEFGHFAQRSMAIGSWVYIAQQIAEQVVAKRDALDKFLRAISNTDFRIAWVGWLLSLIVWSIRSLMDTLLRLVVLAQRALSRQMEFQADLVAVSLTGSDELIHALHKLQAADEAWSRTLGFADSQLRQGRVPHDLFAVQTSIIDKVGRILGDKNYGKVPPSTFGAEKAHRVFKTSFAQPPQMWSTHPASADREENAKRAYLPAPHDPRSAWLLFDDVEAVKEKVVKCLLGEVKAEPASSEQTVQALDERYALMQYEPRFRGAYLGRALTRHALQSSELYGGALNCPDVKKALDALYTEKLATDLAELRDIEEERTTLKAVHDKIFNATGGRIVHQGREISRRELPAAIAELLESENQVRQRIIAHDRQCRGVHLAAAQQVGQGWREYLTGVMDVLHYAEHTLADLRDAQGLLGNVFSVVTADGKVSAKELKRLLGACNILYEVLGPIFSGKADLNLDELMLARLEVKSWSDMLEEFTLPPASNENINDWIRVIDGWVESAAGALAAVSGAALEQLLLTEDKIARHVREQNTPESAPPPSRTPAKYRTLLPGQERKRQQRLDFWDRFQTADGLFPATARVLVAGAIVGAVLGFGSIAGITSTVSVYNGLDRMVEVKAGSHRRNVPPLSSSEIEVELDETSIIETNTADGQLIERFTPALSGHAQNYVYNVAGASPLVEWTARYGAAPERPPNILGAIRWTVSSADVILKEPPKTISTKGGGDTRSVLSGAGDLPPEEQLSVLKSDAERKQVILAHTKWDKQGTERAQQWQALAKNQ